MGAYSWYGECIVLGKQTKEIKTMNATAINGVDIYLPRWTLPSNYGGAEWYEYYSAGVGQSRDSEPLEQSNFRSMLRVLGGESDTVRVVHEGHWAVGWVEWIAIHESDTKSILLANEVYCGLDNYPVIDDEDFSQLEYEVHENDLYYELHRDDERVAAYYKELDSGEFDEPYYPSINYELVEIINNRFDELEDWVLVTSD